MTPPSLAEPWLVRGQMNAIGPTVMLAAGIAVVASVPALFVASQLKKSRNLPRMPVWPFALTLVLSLVVTAAIRPYWLDRYRIWYVDTFAEKLMAKLENQQPVYGVVRKHDPALYAEIRVVVLDGLKRDVSSEELTILARKPIETYVDKFMFQVPDQEFLQFMILSADLMADLSTANPTLCADMIMGKPYGDIFQYMSKELTDREVAATEALITAPKSADRAKLPPDEVTNLVLQLMNERSAATGIPMSDFLEMGDGTIPPARACTAATEFIQAAVKLPPEQAAPLLRTLNDMK